MIEKFNFLSYVIKYVMKNQQDFLQTFAGLDQEDKGVLLDVTFSNEKVRFTYYWADEPESRECPFVNEVGLNKFLVWYE